MVHYFCWTRQKIILGGKRYRGELHAFSIAAQQTLHFAFEPGPANCPRTELATTTSQSAQPHNPTHALPRICREDCGAEGEC